MKWLAYDLMPPFAVPASFLLAAPVAIVAAGTLLAAFGSAALATHWAPATLALVHLLTLGVIATVMVGATYQLVPVVGGRPVPGPRLAHVVHALLVVGLVAFEASFLGWRPALPFAVGALGAGFGLFVGQIGMALALPGPDNPTVAGMRLALASLVGLVVLGLILAVRHPMPVDRGAWLATHVAFALLGWVGTMMAAVSWRVFPMFWMAPVLPERLRQAVLGLIAVGLLLAVGALANHRSIALAAPAALAVWFLQPAAMAWSLWTRRRARRDAAVLAWWVSLASAPLVGLLALCCTVSDDPRAPLWFGWLALWGWAGAAIHGMLTRIVPFLARYHAAEAGSLGVVLPDRRARVGVALHVLALVAGLVAIAWPPMAQVTGVLVALTGAWLGAALVRVVLPRNAAPAETAVPA